MAGAFGAPGVAGEVGSSGSASNALPAVAFEDILVPRVESSLAPSAFVPGGERGSVLVLDHLLQGVRFGTPPPDLHLYSDASWSGWGAHLLDRFLSGVWSEEEQLLHIILLEMKAMFLALQLFREIVTSH